MEDIQNNSLRCPPLHISGFFEKVHFLTGVEVGVLNFKAIKNFNKNFDIELNVRRSRQITFIGSHHIASERGSEESKSD